MKNQKGFTEVVSILFVIIIVLAIAAGAFYYLKSIGKDPTNKFGLTRSAQELPISDSDLTTDIEKELDSTLEADFTDDFEELEADASSL